MEIPLVVAGQRAADARRPDRLPGRKLPGRGRRGLGLGIPRDAIRAGLESFAADLDKVPGRFNVLEIGGATVVVDYGHNVSALAALIEAIEQFPHERRTVVYSAAGDRRDCDMIRQGEMLGDAFDRVILYEDHYLRGRADGEIMNLFRQGLANGQRVADVQEFRGNIRAIETALRHARPGELLVVQADKIDETMEFLRQVSGRRRQWPRDRSGRGSGWLRGRVRYLLRHADCRLNQPLTRRAMQTTVFGSALNLDQLGRLHPPVVGQNRALLDAGNAVADHGFRRFFARIDARVVGDPHVAADAAVLVDDRAFDHRAGADARQRLPGGRGCDIGRPFRTRRCP